MNKDAWGEALREHARARRERVPIPARETLSAEEEWHCRVIGGEFLGWYRQGLGRILDERHVLSRKGFDEEPLIVITTSMPGLVAMREIVPDPPPHLIYLLHQEFNEWEKEHPVDSFTFHIHHWSFFEGADGEVALRARTACPDAPAPSLRVHRAGTLWGRQCGDTSRHLWQWQGEKLVLLQEGFSRAVY